MRLYLGLLLIGMGLGGCTSEISQVETAKSISTTEGTNNTSNELAPTLTEPNSKDLEASSILPEKQVSKHVALKSCKRAHTIDLKGESLRERLKSEE